MKYASEGARKNIAGISPKYAYGLKQTQNINNPIKGAKISSKGVQNLNQIAHGNA